MTRLGTRGRKLVEVIHYSLTETMKYQIGRVASWFNHVIELNQKMSIVSKFLTKIFFFLNFVNTIEFLIN